MNYLFDTHAWIWWHTAPEKLSPNVRGVVGGLKADDQLFLSAISVWEVAKLVEKNRFRLSIGIDLWIRQALDMPRLQWLSLSPEIVIESTRLPPPIHDDPADQIIVASARLRHAAVLTADRLISTYPHVRSIW